MYYHHRASNAFTVFVFLVESQKIMTILSKQDSKPSPSSRNCWICRSTPPETSSSFPVKNTVASEMHVSDVTKSPQKPQISALLFAFPLHLFIYCSLFINNRLFIKWVKCSSKRGSFSGWGVRFLNKVRLKQNVWFNGSFLPIFSTVRAMQTNEDCTETRTGGTA